MPLKSKRPCSKPGCPNLANGRYCEEHQREHHDHIEKQRGTAAERGYDSKWRRARSSFLRKHPLCEHCKNAGRLTAATIVDHIIPHKGDMKLFWDSNNWQSLCKKHHDRKTAREDGGFGN